MKKVGKWTYDRAGILITQFHVNHKTYIKSTKLIVTKENIRIAEKMALEYYDSVIKGVHYEQGERIKLSDIIERYLTANSKRPDIASKKSQQKRINEFFKDRWFDDIRQNEVYRYIERLEQDELSTYTINHHMTTLRQVIEYAKKFNYKLPEITCPTIKNKKKPVRFFTEEEISKILVQLHPDNTPPKQPPRVRKERKDLYEIFITLLDTGARTSEILNLTWADINFAKRQIILYRNKVKNITPIPMTDRVFNILLSRKNTQSTTYVFPSKDGDKPRDRSLAGIRWAIDRANVNAQNELTRTGRIASVRTTRSTFASQLVTNGVSLYTVAQLLGHASTRQTEESYARLANNNEINNAIGILNEKNRAPTVISLTDRNSAIEAETGKEEKSCAFTQELSSASL